MRQILALVLGIVSGLVPLEGGFGFAAFSFVAVFVPFFYYSLYCKVNIDDYGAWALIIEGLQNSTALFILIWVLVYSAVGIN